MNKTRIVHVVHGFSMGGLENVIVQLINLLPVERYEHTVLSLTTVGEFRERVIPRNVEFIALNKPPGHAIPLYFKVFKLLRRIRPHVLHTCNLSALEIAPIGWLAGVPRRIHAEHGFDTESTDSTNTRHQTLRRFYKPFVHHHIAVSVPIGDYLNTVIGVPQSRSSIIPNGVDTRVFKPASEPQATVAGCPFSASDHWLVGTVGRLQSVKNQVFLARAFVRLLNEHPELAKRVRLLIVGEGPGRVEIERILRDGQMIEYAWLPGARDDVAAILRMLDCFVLPSLSEGTSCTLQEAMASGLPVIATAVGGTPALVEEGVTGQLIQPDDDEALASALWRAYAHPDTLRQQGEMARQRAVENFALETMIASYDRLFSIA